MNNENLNSGNSLAPAQLTPAITPKQKVNKKKLVIIAAIIVDLLLLSSAGVFASQQHSRANTANQKLATTTEKLTTTNNQVADLNKQLTDRKNSTGEANIDKNNYQSVFMKSDQVYFGKITKITDTQITLEDIYYLKNNGDSAGSTTLVKLGNELHGPQDKMFIERKEVQFWENLKADGDVAKAIAEYHKQHPN